MKKYTFKLVVYESNDEFWEDINKHKVTGCEEVTKMIKEALSDFGIDPDYEFSNDELILEKFEEVEDA